MNTMLATAQAAIRRAARELGYDEAAIEAFLEPENKHVIQVKAGGKTYPGYRVQHNSKLGPYKGGIRFHPNVTLDEAQALATLMSLKTAAAGLPLGGGKGGIAVDPRALSKAELEELSRDYARQLAPHIGSSKDIPAPDVNTNGEIMAWMVDEFEKTAGRKDPGSFTGKAVDAGGSEGREAATGRGGVLVLIEYLRADGRLNQPFTVALQGFGNVGYFFAKTLRELCPKAKLIAISNSQHTWVKEDGMDVSRLVKKTAAPRPEDLHDAATAVDLAPDAIIGVEADVLVLAALEDAVHADNVDQVRAKTILELANGPITKEAEAALLAEQVAVLPDVVANAGGVIVSYLEWRQNLAGEHWSEARVNDQLAALIVPAAKAMLERAAEKNIAYKQAAFEIALERLLS